jgi:hypothetical protein
MSDNELPISGIYADVNFLGESINTMQKFFYKAVKT